MNNPVAVSAFSTILAAVALLAAVAPAPAQVQKQTLPKKVVAYVPNWVDLKKFSKEIPYAKLTHINIAFENPTNAAGDLSFSDDDNVLIKAAHANKVKVLVSIGGGAASSDKALLARYFDLLTDAKRATFAAKITEYVIQHNFDGVDVDIEGPAINKDYGAFIAALS